MTTSTISLITWTDYIARKLDEGEDPDIFCANHPWELNYLLRQIKALYPQYTDTCIFLSIRAAMKSMRVPLKRLDYIEAVIKDLLKRKPFEDN